MKVFISCVLVFISFSIFGFRCYKGVTMEQNCTGYLKRAADANTVETAKEQLSKSIEYLEVNNLTTGYTSIFYKTPDEDISFWYKNLKASEKELSKVDSNTSQLEKSNLLMKLRETLLDAGEKGDNLIVPDGLSVYPTNAMWVVLIFFSIALIIGVILYWMLFNDDY